MELAARQFARRVLLIHLFILVVILASVIVAARGVYVRARTEALAQAQQRQELLASQTARGIENFYESIFSNLEVIRRGGQRFPRSGPLPQRRQLPPDREGNPRPGAPRTITNPQQRFISGIAEVMWNQLDTRASSLIAVERATGEAFDCFPQKDLGQAQAVIDQARPWLATLKETRPTPGDEASREDHSISPMIKVSDRWAHLLAVHEVAPGVLLVAVVPMDHINDRYFSQVNAGSSVRATLVDDSGQVIAAASQLSIGENLKTAEMGPVLRDTLRDFLSQAGEQTRILESETHFKDRPIDPRLLTVEPIPVGGRTWHLLISSPLADVEGIVWRIFKYALGWSILVVVAMTATLVSTSAWMIRSRLRAERLRNQLMKKELSEARKIQLAWLPGGRISASDIDIAAVNEPASHISGDFYDWFEMPDGRTAVTIGDVTGHGMSAAFLMSTTQLLIRNTLLRTADPGRCLEEVNRQLCSQKFNGQFVTILVMLLDISSGTLEAANAGHYPPLLCDGGRVTRVPLESQLVMGVEGDEKYPTERFDLPESFTLLLYTDGVLDACSPHGERYSVSRLQSAVPADAPNAQVLVQAVSQAVRTFAGAGDLVDDLTLVAIQGQASSAGVLTGT